MTDLFFSAYHLFYLSLVVLCGAIAGAASIALIARGRGWWIAFGNWSSASGRIFVRERYRGINILGWCPFVRVRLRYWVRIPEYRHRLEREIMDLRDIQGTNGTWDHDPYQLGLYNGLETAAACLGGRAADFRSPPDSWLDKRYNEHQLTLGHALQTNV